MAKRILAAVIALLITLFGVVVFCIVFGNLRMPGEDYTRFTAALLLLAGCIYIFRRGRRWPAVLLLIGSVALILLETHQVISWYIFENRMDLLEQHPWWWPTCTEDSRI